jgi:ubiquinone biosynthesis protein
MFSGFRRTQQRIERSSRIAEILVKYGFGFVVEQLGLTEPGWLLRRSLGRPATVERLSVYERVRCILEELGPTFVKFGQVLSTRADLLPHGLIVELNKLQDEVPPFPFSVARAMIETELGDTLEHLFSEFDLEPFASASIGQVYHAVLPDGTQVVVKVQRPGVEKQAEADLLIMRDLAHLAARRTEWGKNYALEQLVEEFGYQLGEQLDYAIEGRHTDRFRRIMPDVPRMYVPKVFWEYSSRRLLTTEFVEGIKLDNLQLLDEAGIDRRDLAASFVEIMATQVLSYEFYHADPHPGNLMATTDGTIIFVDFGMVGYLDEDLKEQLLNLVLSLVQHDADGIVHTLLSVGIVEHRIDQAQLKADIRRVLRRYYEMALAEIPLAEAINEIFGLAAKYEVRFPADLTLLIKVALMVQGLATQLDPDMSIIDVATPFALRIQRERLSPQFWLREASRELTAVYRLSHGLPARINVLLQLLESGEFTVRAELPQLTSTLRSVSVMVNRVAAAMIFAATLIASTLVLRSDSAGPVIYDVPVLAVIGFVGSLIMGFWLFIAILRSGAL